MGNVRHYCTALGRLHRSGGHGIHSPFAFKFVLRVLREKSAYYAYSDIKELRRKAALVLRKAGKRHAHLVTCRDARMIFRITNYYNPDKILEIGSCYGVVSSIMMMVSSRSELFRYEPKPQDFEMPGKPGFPTGSRLKYFDNFSQTAAAFGKVENPFLMINHVEPADYEQISSYVADIQENGGVIILRNLSHSELMRDLWKQIEENGSFGMGFSNDRIAVFTGCKKLPKQNFSLWF